MKAQGHSQMLLRGLSIALLAFAMSACDNAPPATSETSPQTEPQIREDVKPVMGPERVILAFGNSLFAGYGVGIENSYPAQLENALRASGVNAKIVNAGVSGDTTAAGLQRLAFTLDAQDTPPEMVLLELGGNDLLRNIAPSETRANLAAMIEEISSRGIKPVLYGMRAPPNYGPEFQSEFDGLYGELAEETDAELIPFWLESIYQRPELFQDDRIHPTRDGLGELVKATKGAVTTALPELEETE
jgi:acyl-CoA thioesterase-1